METRRHLLEGRASGTALHLRRAVGIKMEAFVLIQTEIGKAPSVVLEINKINGVTPSLIEETAVYDIIVHVEDDDFDEIMKTVRLIEAIDGMTRTMTAPVVKV